MTTRIAPTVRAALVVAATALVAAPILQAAYQWSVSSAISQYAAQHPHSQVSAFCGWALLGNSASSSPWPFWGSAAALLVGGVACLVLALVRPSRGSRFRRQAVAAGVAEIAASAIWSAVNIVVITSGVMSCID